MSFIRTVLGDISPRDLGVCYAHEHIIIDKCFATERYPEFLIDSAALATAELTEFHKAGGRAMVDSMPANCGRNVLKLAEVSRATGVHILCPTGLHLSKYYPPGHWAERMSVDELAALFVAEIETGIDAHDFAGSEIHRSGHRAGVIKVAGGLNTLSPHERRLFEAAAQAQVRTGCPILTHVEEGTAALEQIEILKTGGADLAHVVLSHTDRKPELNYHREILSSGVKVEYDSCFRWKSEQGNPTLDLLTALLPEFPNQIMLGMDAARRSYWKSYGGGPGLTFLLTTFTEIMRDAGIAQALIHKVFVENPASTFQFGGRA